MFTISLDIRTFDHINISFIHTYIHTYIHTHIYMYIYIYINMYKYYFYRLPYNLYPIVHVVPNDAKKNLIYVFANKKSIIYDLDAKVVAKTLPDIPGNSPR